MITVVNSEYQLITAIDDDSVDTIYLNQGTFSFDNTLSLINISKELLIEGVPENGQLPVICGLKASSNSVFPICYCNEEPCEMLHTGRFIDYRIRLTYSSLVSNKPIYIFDILEIKQYENNEVGKINAINQFKAQLSTYSYIFIYCEFKVIKLKVHYLSNDVIQVSCGNEVSSEEASHYFELIEQKIVSLRIFNPVRISGKTYYGNYLFSEEGITYLNQNSNNIYKVADIETLVELSNSHNITFRNIRFIGNAINNPTLCQDQADFLVSSAIRIGRGCSNIKFENCVFEHLHGYCIGVGDTENDSRQENGYVVTDNYCDCGGITITGCTFQHIYGGAIHLNNCQDCTISGNTITDYGKLLASSCAILMRSGFGVQITGNAISDGYYTGISVGWDWNYTRPGQCHDNMIANNTITNVLRSDTFMDENGIERSGILMYDGGGIYTLGISHGTVIHHNVIHDVCQGHKSSDFRSFVGPHDMLWNFSAIYLDEASSFIKVYENVLYNNPVNVHIHHGNGLELYDNLFAYPTICNLTVNYNYRHFPSIIINNEEVEHPYTTGPIDKAIVEDAMFFSYRNIYIQETGRVFRLPFHEECYFTGDMFDVYGNNVHRGCMTDILSDAKHADGCFEYSVHTTLFSVSDGIWTPNENYSNGVTDNLSPSVFYEIFVRQYFQGNSDMNRIRVSCPYWYNKLCFLVMVRQQTKLRMDASFRYLIYTDCPSNWHESDSSHEIDLEASKEYIICAENFYDGYVTFRDITQLKVFDVTIVRQIHEFHTSGNYFEYAYLSCHDLHKLRYVEQLQVRYGLRDLSDRHLVSLAQFKSLGLLLLGGAMIYTDSHYGGTADWHIKRLFIPDGIMAQLALLNIGVKYVPHNLGSLRSCVSLSLFGSPVWKYLADKVVETVDPLTEDTVLSFRDEYKPLPISEVYLSANAYFEEFVYLKDMFDVACQQAAE